MNVEALSVLYCVQGSWEVSKRKLGLQEALICHKLCEETLGQSHGGETFPKHVCCYWASPKYVTLPYGSILNWGQLSKALRHRWKFPFPLSHMEERK